MLRLLLFLLLPVCLSAQREAFTDFRATVELDSLGRATVAERITVAAAGKSVKRGIIRGIDRGPVGNQTTGRGTSRLRVRSASRDGQPEKYRTKNSGSVTDVYLGRKDKRLKKGTHVYDLTYETTNNIYFLPEAEDFRFPVFNADSRLPLDAATVTLRIPEGAAVRNTVCYAGGSGSRDSTACSVVMTGDELTYTLTRGLPAGEGFLIGAVFAPGTFVQPPPGTASPAGTSPGPAPAPAPPPTLLQQKGSLWAGLLGLLGMFFYGYTTWKRHGVDPPTPVVGAQYHPPAELSPAAMAIYSGLAVTHHGLTAALTALVTKGYVSVTEETKKGFLSSSDFFVIRTLDQAPGGDLRPEEAHLLDLLTAHGELRLDGEYDERVGAISQSFNDKTVATYKPLLHVPVNGWRVAAFFGIGLVACAAGAFFLKSAPVEGQIVLAVCLAVALIGGFVFWYLLQQPTPAQVDLFARKKAFEKYLKLKESERKQLPNAPKMTEAYFGTILPYAVGLGISNDWADTLAGDLAATARRPDDNVRAVHLGPLLGAGFGQKFSSASAATSMPASSGGGGGGFSGGGGGVGGGGGAGSGGW